MLLAVDIGNSNVVVGLLEDKKICNQWRLSTKPIRTKDEIRIQILQLFTHENIDTQLITGAIIASVVPNLTNIFIDVINVITSLEPIVVGPGIKTGLKVKIDNQKEVGADLIATAVGAHELYKRDCIVIDCGTATKLTFITNEGDFRGGSIAPGLEMVSNALSSGTAALPMVPLLFPESPLGNNTVSAMQSGIMYGYCGLINELTERFINHTTTNVYVVATGGIVHRLLPNLKHIDIYNNDLLIQGLAYIYEKNKKKW